MVVVKAAAQRDQIDPSVVVASIFRLEISVTVRVTNRIYHSRAVKGDHRRNGKQKNRGPWIHGRDQKNDSRDKKKVISVQPTLKRIAREILNTRSVDGRFGPQGEPRSPPSADSVGIALPIGDPVVKPVNGGPRERRSEKVKARQERKRPLDELARRETAMGEVTVKADLSADFSKRDPTHKRKAQKAKVAVNQSGHRQDVVES